jgi:hypothetical protein
VQNPPGTSPGVRQSSSHSDFASQRAPIWRDTEELVHATKSSNKQNFMAGPYLKRRQHSTSTGTGFAPQILMQKASLAVISMSLGCVNSADQAELGHSDGVAVLQRWSFTGPRNV